MKSNLYLRSSRRLIFAIACSMAFSAFAFSPEAPLEDAAQEKTAQSLFQALRCVVCEGQSLAESDATLARQMRREIRHMLQDGSTASEITAFFQSRYGDTILMSPPLKPRTYPLWGAPFILILIGTALVWRRKKA